MMFRPNGLPVLDDFFGKFKDWLKSNGFCPPEHFILAEFEGTGRSLMTTRDIAADELIISIPEKLLITTHTVFASCIGNHACSFMPRLSPLQVLCAFLMVEHCKGKRSQWEPYLAMLPRIYSTAAFCPGNLIQYFPDVIQEHIRCYQRKLTLEYKKLRPFLKHVQCSLSLPEDILSFVVFRWAWATVNTRCVYLKTCVPTGTWPENDHCALAPFLDLLNHSSDARVLAGYNSETRTYDIRVLQDIRKDQQVFICYGPHANDTLLLEYGFVLSHNPNSVVEFRPEEILDVIEETLGRSVLNAAQTQLHLLNINGVSKDLSATWEGPSWCLTTAIELLLKGLDQCYIDQVLLSMFQHRIHCCLKQKEKLGILRKPSGFLKMANVLVDEEIAILKECLSNP